MHVHLLPPPIMARVREHFAAAGPLLGRPWPIHYATDDETSVELLRSWGVLRFSTLPYAHRPGVATYLNDWAASFAATHHDNLASATFYPEEGVGAEVAQRLDAGTEIFKVHVQVGQFDVNDPLLDKAWGQLEDAGAPVVVHAGSGPVATAYTGPEPMGRLLARFPRLTAVIAHLGAPEYEEFLILAEAYERVHLDTTMAFTPFFEDLAPYPGELLSRLRDVGDKVLLGSDFPNIPYPYETQLQSLERLDLGDDWLRRVCWTNSAQLFGLDASGRSSGEG